MDKNTEELLVGLAQAIKQASSPSGVTKTISGTPDTQLLFGPNGLFSNFGLDDTVINAHISPKGIGDLLPAFGTTITNPVYPFITGFESDGVDEPEGVCDDAPSGEMETCHQVAAFGRFTRSTKEMEVNELMQVLNGSLTTNLRLLGSLLGDGHQLMPQQGMDQNQVLRNVVMMNLVVVGIEFQRLLARKLWTGTPANNTAGGGYKEFPGLDMLIATGKIDAFTGVACPALDPDVKDFDYSDVDGTDKSIVTYLTMMEAYLRHVASRTGMDPVDWVIVMRPDLWRELTAVWPCQYLTDRCGESSSGNAVAVINDNVNVNMRDQMRNGMYLVIGGRQYPVMLDDGINEETPTDTDELAPGEYASDIYFVPVRAKSMPVLYWEYLDYSPALQQAGAFPGFDATSRFWATDGGRYLWSTQNLNWCFKIQGKMEPRVILRTPQLAGRLQNVKYSPLQHLRSWDENSEYFKKGGNSEYTTPPTYYSEWSALQ